MTQPEHEKKNPEYEAPTFDWETRAYWEGCGRGELVLQRCRACNTVQHRPRGLCASCLAGDIEHFVASGRGTVYTYSVVRQNQMPAFREALPYVVSYIELEEGPQLLSNIVGCAPEDVSIGMAVKVEFVPTPSTRGDALGVPRFVPA
jgi:uncharacterized OB-fold protein